MPAGAGGMNSANGGGGRNRATFTAKAKKPNTFAKKRTRPRHKQSGGGQDTSFFESMRWGHSASAKKPKRRRGKPVAPAKATSIG